MKRQKTIIMSNIKFNPKVVILIRAICLALQLALVISSAVVSGIGTFLDDTLKFLTYWGMWATLIYFACVMFHFNFYSIERGFFAMLNHMVVSLNVLITIFWFGFIFTQSNEINADFVLGILRHSIPLILTLIEFIFNNHLIFYSNMPLLLVVIALYLPTNYLVTKRDGKPVYDVIDYKGAMSVVAIFGAIVLCLFSAAIMVALQSITKRWIFKILQDEYERVIETGDVEYGQSENIETKKENGNQMLSISKIKVDSNKLIVSR